MPELADPEHEIICGMIGMGKSYWVLYKIVQSLLADRPCCYIDPKGDTYRNLLAFFASTTQGKQIWEHYRHRILLLNPVAVGDYLLAFNAIEPMGDFYFARPDRGVEPAPVVPQPRGASGLLLAGRGGNLVDCGDALVCPGCGLTIA